jgi:hypothetical protein
MQRRFVCLSIIVGLAGCASLDPNVVTLSRADLQTLVERAFPRRQRFSDLVELSLAQPSLQLLPERNRLATALELTATEGLRGNSLRGRLAIEHTLRFEPSDATVRLARVKVDALDFQLAGARLPAPVAQLGARIAEQALDDFVIYRLGDERRQQLAAAGVNHADMTVTSRGIELRFSAGR